MFREDDTDDLMENLSPKVLVCLCVDTNDALSDEQKIETENGINRYLRAIREDREALNSVDLAVISYGGTPRLLREFSTIAEVDEVLELQDYYGSGSKLNDAVELALTILNDRKQYYVKNDIDFYQPELIIIGGSRPNDDIDISVEMIKNLVAANALTHFIFAAGEGDFSNELGKLVVSTVGLQEVSRLKDYDFEGFYDRYSIFSDDISYSISHEISSEYEYDDDIDDKLNIWREMTTVYEKHDDNSNPWQELPENNSVLITPDSEEHDTTEQVVPEVIDEEESGVDSNSVDVPFSEETLNDVDIEIKDIVEHESIDTDDVEELDESTYSRDYLNTNHFVKSDDEYDENVEYENELDNLEENSASDFSVYPNVNVENRAFDDLNHDEFFDDKLIDEIQDTKNSDVDYSVESEVVDEQKFDELEVNDEHEVIQEVINETNEIEPYIMKPNVLDDDHNEFNSRVDKSEPIFVESTFNDEIDIPDEWTIAAQILNAHSEKYGIKSNRISLPIHDDDIEDSEDLTNWDKNTDNIMDSISLYSESEEIISSDINNEYEPDQVESAGDELDSWDNISYNHRVNENYGLEVIDMDSLTIKLRQLKLNKELLDSNAITVEEFEFVKRQILGDITRG